MLKLSTQLLFSWTPTMYSSFVAADFDFGAVCFLSVGAESIF